jgi:serine phosphatase RsbU (regulator of sigma subunit)
MIQLQPGDSCYLFSDGFADQFGGEQGKKLMSKRFKEYLAVMQHLPMKKQQEQLSSCFIPGKETTLRLMMC